MKIGDLAKTSGVNAKMVRHYEAIGLIAKASRTDGGYRTYSETDVQFLRFIRRARGLGFSMKEIKKLLSLWKNKSRSSQDVKALTSLHVKNLELKIQEMQEMVHNLKKLSQSCHGDHRPDCPIIESLSDSANDFR